MKIVKIILVSLGFVFFFLSMFLLFEPKMNLTGLSVYTPSLAIINYDNNVNLNNELEIGFIARGSKNLMVTVLKGDMEFVELRCEDEVLRPVLDGKEINYQDYDCSGNSYLVVKVLSRQLDLEFAFGSDVQQARNTAS